MSLDYYTFAYDPTDQIVDRINNFVMDNMSSNKNYYEIYFLCHFYQYEKYGRYFANILSIYPKIVEYDKGAGSPGSFTSTPIFGIVHPQVIDQNSNLDPNVVETVSVKITSVFDPEGFNMTLPETGPELLALAGFSLLGAGIARRRKRKKL